MDIPPILKPEPGWYRDPDGGEALRWWDGDAWSQSIAGTPGGDIGIDSSGGVPENDQPTEFESFISWCKKLLGISYLILGIALGVGIMFRWFPFGQSLLHSPRISVWLIIWAWVLVALGIISLKKNPANSVFIIASAALTSFLMTVCIPVEAAMINPNFEMTPGLAILAGTLFAGSISCIVSLVFSVSLYYRLLVRPRSVKSSIAFVIVALLVSGVAFYTLIDSLHFLDVQTLAKVVFWFALVVSFLLPCIAWSLPKKADSWSFIVSSLIVQISAFLMYFYIRIFENIWHNFWISLAHQLFFIAMMVFEVAIVLWNTNLQRLRIDAETPLSEGDAVDRNITSSTEGNS